MIELVSDIEKIRIIWEGSSLPLDNVASLFDVSIDRVEALKEQQGWKRIKKDSTVYIKHDQIGQTRRCIKKHVGCSAMIEHEENTSKRTVKYEYKIISAYSHVFICQRKSGILTSFSYKDIICNRIKIKFIGGNK